MFIESILPEYLANSFIFKLLVACFLGAIIGFERDIHGRAAGLRTNLLVSLGAAVFMILSESIALSYSSQTANSFLRADPSRIAAQIITGIGFLGAGAIIKYGFSIRGLTTAACLWISAAIGMSAGAGYYDIGVTTTLIGLFSLTVLNKIENIYLKDSYRYLEIRTPNKTDVSILINIIKRKNLKIVFFDKERDYIENIMQVCFTLKLRHKDATDKLSHQIISDLEKSDIELYSIKWHHQ